MINRLLNNFPYNSNPCTGLGRPWGFQEVEAPRFQENWHMKEVRLSSPRPWIRRAPRRKKYETFRVNNQLDALFLMCLFHFSTCFEQPSAHHQENLFCQYIIWYISLRVGGRLVCRSLTCIPDGHLHGVLYTRWCTDTIDSPDDEHWVARNM